MIEWLAAGAAGCAALGLSARYTWWRRPLHGVPVLMYHLISDELGGTRLPKLRVSPKDFARQLDALLDQGYTTLTLGQAALGRPKGRSVVITFDDGYMDFYHTAWPLLRERGMTATVFVVTGQLDGINLWDRDKGEAPEQLLTRQQVRELAADGVEFGGHSHSHADLTSLEGRALKLEIIGCQKVLSDLLGRPARTFSYPYGLHNSRVRRAVAAAGFTTAVTIRPGMLDNGSDLLAVPRIIVKRSDDRLDFALKLTRGRSRL